MRVLVLGAAAITAGCGNGFVHDEKLAGPYHLVAVDEMEQMALCRSLDGGDCAGDGLGGETVFAAGENDRFITLAIHPRKNWPEAADRARTEYYYLIRSSSEAQDGGREARLMGPFNQRQFATEKARLRLPDFTRVFDELE
jgi:hypothetical protein